MICYEGPEIFFGSATPYLNAIIEHYMKLSGNKILITGGASGIGLGLTERFLEEKNTVIICGRRADKLREVQQMHPSVITRQCDIAIEQDRIDLYNWIASEHGDTNILINNAGIQNWMHIDDDKFYAKAKDEIGTNVTAPVHLVTLFLQLSSIKTIINITSGLAFVPFAKVPVYCATKAFMRSFTRSLRYMLREKDVEVIEMIPPALNTDLGGKGIHDAYPPVSDFVNAIFEQMKEGRDELTFGTSELMLAGDPNVAAQVFDRLNP